MSDQAPGGKRRAGLRTTRRVALALLGAALAATAQEPDPFGAPPPDPFGAPAPDPFGGVAAVPSSSRGAASDAGFDPSAVRAAARPGVWLGPVELHGRINLTLSFTDDAERVELLDDTSLELSSADLYAQWFPCPWFGLLGELELESDLHDRERALEVEVELLVAEVRPLGDDRLRLRAGYFPAPFGVERRFYAPSRNVLANRPAAFRRVYPGDYNDWGVMAWWRQPLGAWGGELEVEAALLRGLEGPLGRADRPAFFERDDNHEPMFAGRVGLTLFDVAPADGGLAGLLGLPLRLTLGASLLFGHHDDAARARLRVLGFDAALTLGELSARVEVVLADLEADGPATRDRRAEGLYALLVWRRRFARPWLEEGFVALRYDVADPDARARDGHDVERWHVGLGWVPAEGWLVKLGFETSRQGAERPRTVFVEVGYSF